MKKTRKLVSIIENCLMGWSKNHSPNQIRNTARYTYHKKSWMLIYLCRNELYFKVSNYSHSHNLFYYEKIVQIYQIDAIIEFLCCGQNYSRILYFKLLIISLWACFVLCCVGMCFAKIIIIIIMGHILIFFFHFFCFFPDVIVNYESITLTYAKFSFFSVN